HQIVTNFTQWRNCFDKSSKSYATGATYRCIRRESSVRILISTQRFHCSRILISKWNICCYFSLAASYFSLLSLSCTLQQSQT
ncbi:hypothetical protein DY000_02031982, partial [Brassica cretica]